MPFPDELSTVQVVPYRKEWAWRYYAIADELRALDLADTGAIDHVGSTAVPGLVAKDVIDVQVRLKGIDQPAIRSRFEQAGFRRRPEQWEQDRVHTVRANPQARVRTAREQPSRQHPRAK